MIIDLNTKLHEVNVYKLMTGICLILLWLFYIRGIVLQKNLFYVIRINLFDYLLNN